MDDKQIIRLFFERSEQAITELSQKYGALCLQLADNILNDHQDAEECVNDAYLGAWNSIPPQSPDPLRAYICRISGSSLDEQLAVSELTAQINAFLSALPRDDRVMFVKRYWFSESLSEIADTFAITENNASVRLSRIRGKLHQHLKEAAL